MLKNNWEMLLFDLIEAVWNKLIEYANKLSLMIHTYLSMR